MKLKKDSVDQILTGENKKVEFLTFLEDFPSLWVNF